MNDTIDRPLAAAVSGSFHRHLGAVQAAVFTLMDAGVRVLSPADPRVVDSFGEFVFVSSDLRRTIKGVQNRHLEAIGHADFLWLVCPDGYVGQSAAMELGFAVARGVPVFTDAAPLDWTLRQYVIPVGTVGAAVVAVRAEDPVSRSVEPSLLLEPNASLAAIRRDLDEVERALLHDRQPRSNELLDATVGRIRRQLTLPSGR
jgi:hypothetical protein